MFVRSIYILCLEVHIYYIVVMIVRGHPLGLQEGKGAGV